VTLVEGVQCTPFPWLVDVLNWGNDAELQAGSFGGKFGEGDCFG